MKKDLIPNIGLGFSIFTAFLPLSFGFSQGRTFSLLDSPYEWLVWISLVLCAAAMFFLQKHWSRRGSFTLGILFALVPLAFYFSGHQFRFIVLGTHNGVAAGCWGIALGLLYRSGTHTAKLA